VPLRLRETRAMDVDGDELRRTCGTLTPSASLAFCAEGHDEHKAQQCVVHDHPAARVMGSDPLRQVVAVATT
jgi:hypothetical protein